MEFNVPFQHKYGYIRDETAPEGALPVTQPTLKRTQNTDADQEHHRLSPKSRDTTPFMAALHHYCMTTVTTRRNRQNNTTLLFDWSSFRQWLITAPEGALPVTQPTLKRTRNTDADQEHHRLSPKSRDIKPFMAALYHMTLLHQHQAIKHTSRMANVNKIQQHTGGLVSPASCLRRTLSRYSERDWRCLAWGRRSPSGRIWHSSSSHSHRSLSVINDNSTDWHTVHTQAFTDIWNLQGCPKLANRSQLLVGRKFTILWRHVEEILLFNKFFSDCRRMP